MNDLTKEELLEIERQLSCPSGAQGIEMAHTMNQTNIGMISTTIEALVIKDNMSILELGHGNCNHLPLIFNQAKNVHYTGLEISETMNKEALHNGEKYLNQAVFKLYNGAAIPLKPDCFDKIMTVNTVYFWQDPKKLLTEICRVLKPGGVFALTFAQKQFMKHLPFVKSRFKLYDNRDISELVEQTDLVLAEILNKTEQVESKMEELVDRQFSIALLTKS